MSTPSPHAQLDRMITGYWLSQAIYAAAKFGIADLLKPPARSPSKTSRKKPPPIADALYRLLRALASVGIFAEGPPRQFSLTPLAEPLQAGVPDSKRALALMSGDEQFQAWTEIALQHPNRQKSVRQSFRQADLRLPGRTSRQGPRSSTPRWSASTAANPPPSKKPTTSPASTPSSTSAAATARSSSRC